MLHRLMRADPCKHFLHGGGNGQRHALIHVLAARGCNGLANQLRLVPSVREGTQIRLAAVCTYALHERARNLTADRVVILAMPELDRYGIWQRLGVLHGIAPHQPLLVVNIVALRVLVQIVELPEGYARRAVAPRIQEYLPVRIQNGAKRAVRKDGNTAVQHQIGVLPSFS